MSDHIGHVTDDTFENEVLGSSVPVLVDFWAPWCGPCMALGPVMESIAKNRGESVKVVKVNVDENLEVAGRMGIRSIPSVMLFADGELREMTVGAHPQKFFDEMIDRNVLKN